MKRKPEPLPPGTYEVTIERMRKVRGKPLQRIHMNVVGKDHKLTDVIRLEPETQP